MPVTIVSSQPNINPVVISSGKSPVSPKDYNKRVHRDVRRLHNIYPSLVNVNNFLSQSWNKSDVMPQDSRALIARIAHQISKGLSGLEYELPDSISVIGEIDLAQTRTLIFNLEEWMIKYRVEAMMGTGQPGSVSVSLTPEGYSTLTDFEAWNLFEEIYIRKKYYAPFIVDHKLDDLISGVNFDYIG